MVSVLDIVFSRITSVANRKDVIAMLVKWQPSWISQNAQECRILNKDPIEGQHPWKQLCTTFSRQTLFCLDCDGGHIGNWLPIWSQVKSAMII